MLRALSRNLFAAVLLSAFGLTQQPVPDFTVAQTEAVNDGRIRISGFGKFVQFLYTATIVIAGAK
jgi:hypothetical protein